MERELHVMKTRNSIRHTFLLWIRRHKITEYLGVEIEKIVTLSSSLCSVDSSCVSASQSLQNGALLDSKVFFVQDFIQNVNYSFYVTFDRRFTYMWSALISSTFEQSVIDPHFNDSPPFRTSSIPNLKSTMGF